MTANTALSVTGLNFDEIRQNLRTFIAAKPDFADYDFNDSAIGTLLDLLAYNTYYNAYYASMAASESFIDSAQMYDSVVSRAKLVGYTPVSARGATANVLISFSTTANTTFRSISIPINTKFTSVINSVSYTFVTPKSYTVVANTTNGFQSYIDLTEGYPVTHRYLYTSSNTAFVLPNVNVDTNSVTVTVTSNGDTVTYLPVSDILTINSSSKIFYTEADRDLKYKISFGDDVLGDRPDYNSTVAITYRICSASGGNGADRFTATGSIGGQVNFTLTTVSRATGGALQESIESVRFNAPKIYETQNRAVTSSDYQRIILRENQDLQAVSVWGGEENSPPIYGKVFATVKPIQGTLISSARKTQIKTNLRKYNVQAVDLEFVDPTFLYIIPTIRVQLDLAQTTTTPSAVAAAVAARIISFESNNLNRFDGRFRYSRFLDYIDGADRGITGTTADIKLQKRFLPSTTQQNTYTFRFNQQIINPKLESAVNSSQFTYGGNFTYLDDDNAGNMRTYYETGLDKIYTNTNIGTVDYVNGVIVLKNFLPVAYAGLYITLDVNPITQNFIPVRNQILLISDSIVTVYDDTSGKELAKVSTVSTIGETTATNETAIAAVTSY